MNKNYNVKVSYLKEWGSDGTCYRQGFTVNSKILEDFKTYLQRVGDFADAGYLKWNLQRPLEPKNNRYFMNLTQKNYFLFFLSLEGYSIDLKRVIDNNSYLIVKENNKEVF